MSRSPQRAWAVVPAAGGGTRMQAAVPKQYLPLAGRRVLDVTLDALLGSGAFEGLVVVLAAGDTLWTHCERAADPRITTTVGATRRCDSVRNGLARLAELAEPGDYVAVHDAARPCVARHDLQAVLDAARGSPDGALLAVPVADTLKRAGAHERVAETVSRERLWRALTPQVFPLAALRAALAAALDAGREPTDEAQAMEWAGHSPLLVPGSAANLKITHRHDLPLAEALLRQGGGADVSRRSAEPPRPDRD